MKTHYLSGFIDNAVGKIPKVSAKLTLRDFLGTVMVRWSVKRSSYRVEPGLYALGSPDSDSDVFVTGNYKLSFDHLRKGLAGMHAWILVVDTRGINVWCAAGKKTFNAKEIAKRIRLTGLDQIVHHRRLILPQLSATGVSAQAVKTLTRDYSGNESFAGSVIESHAPVGTFSAGNLHRDSGFKVVYGPVRAADIPAFVRNGYKASPEMRKVKFTLTDRIRLIPVDFVAGKLYLLAASALVFLLTGINGFAYSTGELIDHGFVALFNILLAYIAGIILTPVLLPYIPVRMFSAKGAIAGFIVGVVLYLTGMLGSEWMEQASWILIIVSIASFIAMNFTGSSTFTSLSGVRKEMKISIPFQIAGSALGLTLFVLSKLIEMP
ncbi:MAG: mercury methylation corrinoid protein HgcA [Bacteroidales bacterium]